MNTYHQQDICLLFNIDPRGSRCKQHLHFATLTLRFEVVYPALEKILILTQPTLKFNRARSSYYHYHYLRIVSFITAICVGSWLFLLSMSGLYFTLRQRNVFILLTTNPFFPHPPLFLFFPSHYYFRIFIV